MSYLLTKIGKPPMVLHTTPTLRQMSDREVFDFCQQNQDWHIEQTSEGDFIVMPPTGGETGRRNFDLITLFGIWVRQDGTGIGFDSSTGFHLPNGAKRAADLAWVRKDRWEALTSEERSVFPPLCPDFVVELRSSTDLLTTLQEKMDEYIDNGALLGWLIDPYEQKVHIYRPNEAVDILHNPKTIADEAILPGFSLDLFDIWGE